MNMLDYLRSRNIEPKRVAGTHGGEWHSGCPICLDGKDRFHCWPKRRSAGQCDLSGVWGCRVCDKSGDFISLLMAVEGITFKDACKRLDQKISFDGYAPAKLPKTQTEKESLQIVPDAPLPPEKWREKNTALAEYAHQQLLQTPEQLAWLAARGLDKSAVSRYRLGWLPGELSAKAAGRGESPKLWYTRALSAWGMPVDTEQKNRQGKAKTAFSFPAGLTIPRFRYVDGAEQVISLRIRRPDAHRTPSNLPERKYMVFKGAPVLPLVIPPRSAAMPYALVVQETELDAMLAAEIALTHNFNCGSIGLCSNTARPHEAAHKLLSGAAAVLLCLDFDPEDSGGRSSTDKALAKWLATYHRAIDWPVPDGKDLGEAYGLGVDLALWLAAGLPESCLPRAKKTPPATKPESKPNAEHAAVQPLSAVYNDLITLQQDWKELMPEMVLIRRGGGYAISFDETLAAGNGKDGYDQSSAESFLKYLLEEPTLRLYLEKHPEARITCRNFLVKKL